MATILAIAINDPHLNPRGFHVLWFSPALILAIKASISLWHWLFEINVRATTVGKSFRFEPKIIAYYRFYKEAESILSNGYNQVGHSSKPIIIFSPQHSLNLQFSNFKDSMPIFWCSHLNMSTISAHSLRVLRVRLSPMLTISWAHIPT